jgi:DNA-directed RNA polymerase specialized sigma24 family protein
MPSDSTPPQFPPTRWSVVLAAAGDGRTARAALEELCRLYWFPLYAFARQRGCPPEDAEDETQSFLARVAEGKLLATATPERGHLRTYLLAAFQRDLIDAQRRATRQKRGGDAVMVPLDTVLAEDRLANTRASDSPGAAFDRAWALTCLETAAAALAAEYEARGRGALFQALRPFLDPESEGDYAAAGQAARLDANAMRQAVFRLRQRFRVLLRQTIADTLEHPTEALIDEELTALRAALAT